MLIGGHISSSGGLVRALERAEAMGCETMQIFNQSPRMWRPTNYAEADFEAFRARFASSPVDSIFIHAVYLINCASDDAEVRRKSKVSLTHALRVGDAIGAGGVVVHPGTGKGRASAAKTVKMISTAFEKVLSETESCPLLLENTAGAGFTVGRTIEELGEVIDGAGAGPRLGVCLDSCHLLASGYDVRDAGALSSAVDDCERVFGLERLRCLHLNDSKMPLGSNRDRHANLGEGELGEDGVRTFLSEPRFQGLPVLLEVPGPDGHGPDKHQIEIAKRLRPKTMKKAAKKPAR
jgi:deoxyribonuclease IV